MEGGWTEPAFSNAGACHRAGFRASWLIHSYLHDFSVAYVQGLSAAAVQILHDQLQKNKIK